MMQAIKNLAVGAAFGAVLLVGIDYSMSIPDVQVSYTDRSCQQVQNYESIFFGTTQYSCENMPSKYNHVWVK